MSKSTTAARRAEAKREPVLSIEQYLARIHRQMESMFAAASASKALFSAAAVLEVDCDAVMPLLDAGCTISDNQSTVLCAIANDLYGIEARLAGVNA